MARAATTFLSKLVLLLLSDLCRLPLPRCCIDYFFTFWAAEQKWQTPGSPACRSLYRCHLSRAVFLIDPPACFGPHHLIILYLPSALYWPTCIFSLSSVLVSLTLSTWFIPWLDKCALPSEGFPVLFVLHSSYTGPISARCKSNFKVINILMEMFV